VRSTTQEILISEVAIIWMFHAVVGEVS